jgi:hypothetical protein
MAEAALPLAVATAVESTAQRHRLFVRVTHWTQALTFLVLLLSTKGSGKSISEGLPTACRSHL